MKTSAVKIIFNITISLMLSLLFSVNSAFASIVKAINNTTLNRDSVISVVVKDINTNDTIYSKRADTFLNPASILKIFTMAAAIDTLGDNYNFETVIYIDNKRNLYLKLGADPLLTSADLDTLIKSLKKAYGGKINNFYIDDSTIDKVYYPDGWTVDDFWPNSPKISPYIVDKNTVYINFAASKNDIKITQNDDYKFSFINELEISNKTDITPSLNYGENSGIVSLRGTIGAGANFTKEYPVLDTAQFFTGRLRKALDKNGIHYAKPFYPKKVAPNAKRIASFRRPVREVVSYALKTSNNFVCEVVFKAAGAKWAQKTNPKEVIKPGTLEDGKNMFFDYYNKAGLKNNKINLKDASGVSRYNTLSTGWMADALVWLNENSKIKDYMITADEGTLTKRMRDLKGCVKAKTGTIFGISSLAGFVTSQAGANYAFAIIIQNFATRASVIKGLEDDIVHEIYTLE